MNDTPRTNAMLDANGISCPCSDKPVELCRDLECELAAAKELLRELRAQLHACVAASQDMHAAQAAELDALKAERDRLKESNARHAMNAINAICGTCGGSRNQDGVCPDCALATLTAERDALQSSIQDLSHPNCRMLLDERDALLNDQKRLDWLEKELEREQEVHSRTGQWPPSLFRKNIPITRAAIDAARKEQP